MRTKEFRQQAQSFIIHAVVVLLAMAMEGAVTFAVPLLNSMGVTLPVLPFVPDNVWALCIAAVFIAPFITVFCNLFWARGLYRAAGGLPLNIRQILF